MTRENPDANKTRKPDLWDMANDKDVYSYTTIDEAMEMGLDEMSEPLPRIVTLYGFAFKKFDVTTDRIAEHIAEDLDIWLGEDYGNPDDATQLPQVLNDAIETLAKAVVKHWPVWQVEVVETRTIDAYMWVHDHKPQWIADGLEWQK